MELKHGEYYWIVIENSALAIGCYLGNYWSVNLFNFCALSDIEVIEAIKRPILSTKKYPKMVNRYPQIIGRAKRNI